VKQLIHTSLLEFERSFGKQIRDDNSRAMQEIQTSVTNALSPVLSASTSNAKSMGGLETEVKVMKARMYVLTTVGLPIGSAVGFFVGRLL
jgi:hypothetical protein